MRLNPWLLLLFAFSGGGKKDQNGGKTNGLDTGNGDDKPEPTKFKKPAFDPGRPDGDPLGLDCAVGVYNEGYWPTQVSVKNTFEMLGYPVPGDRDTMNKLGPDNALGGGDDLPNIWVEQFQRDYNAVSRVGLLGGLAGGLAPDGFVGPCVLNGLQNVLNFYDGDQWPEVVGANVDMPGG